MPNVRSIAFSTVLLAGSMVLSLGGGEVLLRAKNTSMKNYDIEMWRYAKDLKVRSDDPHLDFDHVTSASSTLQGVTIRLNERGLRGGPIEPLPPGGRRILFLGGSITLGWGVREEETVEVTLQRLLHDAGEQVQVLNGGVGNYNADRYVSRFFKELTPVAPTDIVVHYFLRDAEDLPAGGGNVLLRHSELAVTLWIAFHRLFDRAGETALVDHYVAAYREDAPGFLVMKAKVKELADYARSRGIRIYFAMTPDVHNLVDYKFAFVHDRMRRLAEGEGYTFVDLLPALAGHPPQDLFAMPGDPHPNAFGHTLMAQTLFPAIHRAPAAP